MELPLLIKYFYHTLIAIVENTLSLSIMSVALTQFSVGFPAYCLKSPLIHCRVRIDGEVTSNQFE